MRNNTFILALLLISFVACKKKKDPVAPVEWSSPYHFTFLLNSERYVLEADDLKYLPVKNNELGAYFPANTKSFVPTTSYPTLALLYSWPVGHKVTEADVLGLAAKSIAFSDAAIRPQLIFQSSATSLETWNSIDTGESYYSITLSSVQFLKRDTIAGVPLRCYVIAGTCSTVLRYDRKFSTFSEGEFKMAVATQE